MAATYRKKCLETYSKRCFICNTDGEYVQIIVHHVDGDRSNDDLANLIPLCKVCHYHVHNSTNGKYRYWNLQLPEEEQGPPNLSDYPSSDGEGIVAMLTTTAARQPVFSNYEGRDKIGFKSKETLDIALRQWNRRVTGKFFTARPHPLIREDGFDFRIKYKAE